MSLGPGFIASQVLCLQLLCNFCCNFYATFVATFLQLFWQKKWHFLQLVLQLLCYFLLPKKKLLKVAKKKLQKSCKNSFKKLHKKVATNLQKQLHKSCKHIEPGTQWTRDTKTCFPNLVLKLAFLNQRRSKMPWGRTNFCPIWPAWTLFSQCDFE